jgi:hypothetical protein
MTSDEFRQLLYSLSPGERRLLADRLDVSLRTVQRWSTYSGQQRDATRSHPDLKRLTEEEARIGIQGAFADLSAPANKGSGQIAEEYCFNTWGQACRFAARVKNGQTDNTFLNMAVTGIQIVRFGSGYCCEFSYDVSYTESDGWADRDWDWE